MSIAASQVVDQIAFWHFFCLFVVSSCVFVLFSLTRFGPKSRQIMKQEWNQKEQYCFFACNCRVHLHCDKHIHHITPRSAVLKIARYTTKHDLDYHLFIWNCSCLHCHHDKHINNLTPRSAVLKIADATGHDVQPALDAALRAAMDQVSK